MTFEQATKAFEQWLGRQVDLQPDELAYKHKQLAAKDPFPFFRGTYYRWVQVWPEVCRELQKAPQVLSVGDLHIENFGTWRDGEARLVWGINDFDEADMLPCTNDLVRLAASVWFAIDNGQLKIDLGKACKKILQGYLGQLRSEAGPFVLEGAHPELRNLAMDELKSPGAFWSELRMIDERPKRSDHTAAKALAVLKRALPVPITGQVLRRRVRVGMGSLGKPRYIALAKHNGAEVAREAKALAGPCTHWFKKGALARSRIKEVMPVIARSPDPMYRVDGDWIVRRLAPHCTRIELEDLKRSRDLSRMMRWMGGEIANVHLGTAGKKERIITYLASLPKNWLEDAARSSAKALVKDWKSWRRDRSPAKKKT